jgi:TolA-binding protein
MLSGKRGGDVNTFELEQLQRQRRSFLASIAWLEDRPQLNAQQASTLTRQREQLARIEAILKESGAPLDA